MSKPLCVCVSDIHFNLANLELASAALQAALKKAEDLGIPLVIAGDLNDTKAIIRAEVANRLISILSVSKCPVYILVGNHDLLNEKGLEHSLNFLRPYVEVIDSIAHKIKLDIWLVPYLSNTDVLKSMLSTIPLGSTIIMHQGFLGAAMGDYVQDKTSIDPELVKDFTVISGHYHRHQILGTVTYIGSPYTMSFGEANDGPKGFLVLNEDGSFTREVLNLRKHVVLKRHIDDTSPLEYNPSDLVWVKLTGPESELKKFKKDSLGLKNYKLDLIPIPTDKLEISKVELIDRQLLDSLIDNLLESKDYIDYLKGLTNDLIDR